MCSSDLIEVLKCYDVLVVDSKLLKRNPIFDHVHGESGCSWPSTRIHHQHKQLLGLFPPALVLVHRRQVGHARQRLLRILVSPSSARALTRKSNSDYATDRLGDDACQRPESNTQQAALTNDQQPSHKGGLPTVP